MTILRTSHSQTAGMSPKEYARWLHEQACFSKEEAYRMAGYDELAEARDCAKIFVVVCAAFVAATGIVMLFWG